MIRHALARYAAASLMLLASAAAVRAQDAAQFYKGKNVELYIGYTVGGGYDIYARLLARHLGRFIPGNPNIVPKNMEGAGSVRLANWLANVAPKDGTVIGTIGRGTAFDPVFGQKGAQFKGPDFTWIGSANDEDSVCATMKEAGVSTFENTLKNEVTMGALSFSDDTGQFTKVLANLFGAKFRIVTGYPGGNDVVLAMERGEVQGRCGWSWSSVKSLRPDWLRDKKIDIWLQLALSKHVDLPDVPLVMDLARTDEDRLAMKLIFARNTMGRPFLAPPGVPAQRTAVLRKAFMDTMRDKEFLADAEKAKLEITPVAGEALQDLVGELYRTPPAVAQKAASLLQN
jgi:hypothetical protein